MNKQCGKHEIIARLEVKIEQLLTTKKLKKMELEDIKDEIRYCMETLAITKRR